MSLINGLRWYQVSNVVPWTSAFVVGILFLTSESALADTPFGFYMGGSVGQADARSNLPDFNEPHLADLSEHHFGWDVFVGVRPISLLGAQLEYVDFGHPGAHSPQVPPTTGFYFTENADVHQEAVELSGLLFAPLPIPWLDLYGKAGVARLQTTGQADIRIVCVNVPCPEIAFAPVSLDRTDTRFAYGAGAQVKVAALSVRLEYQRIGSSGEDPDLLSLGLAWRF